MFRVRFRPYKTTRMEAPSPLALPVLLPCVPPPPLEMNAYHRLSVETQARKEGKMLMLDDALLTTG